METDVYKYTFCLHFKLVKPIQRLRSHIGAFNLLIISNNDCLLHEDWKKVCVLVEKKFVNKARELAII